MTKFQVGREGGRCNFTFGANSGELSELELAPDMAARPHADRFGEPPLVIHLGLGDIEIGVDLVEVAALCGPAFELCLTAKHCVRNGLREDGVLDARKRPLKLDFRVARHQVIA